MKRFRSRLYLFWVLYGGNLWKCNRDYWGWVSIRTAWEVAGDLVE